MTRTGIHNWTNCHIWDSGKSHTIREAHFEHKVKINVWCGIFTDDLISPFKLPVPLNGSSYLEFFQNTLSHELKGLPLNQRRDMQDGAPSHFHPGVTKLFKHDAKTTC